MRECSLVETKETLTAPERTGTHDTPLAAMKRNTTPAPRTPNRQFLTRRRGANARHTHKIMGRPTHCLPTRYLLVRKYTIRLRPKAYLTDNTIDTASRARRRGVRRGAGRGSAARGNPTPPLFARTPSLRALCVCLWHTHRVQGGGGWGAVSTRCNTRPLGRCCLSPETPGPARPFGDAQVFS